MMTCISTQQFIALDCVALVSSSPQMSVRSIVVITDSLTGLTSSGITFVPNFAKIGELS